MESSQWALSLKLKILFSRPSKNKNSMTQIGSNIFTVGSSSRTIRAMQCHWVFIFWGSRKKEWKELIERIPKMCFLAHHCPETIIQNKLGWEATLINTEIKATKFYFCNILHENVYIPISHESTKLQLSDLWNLTFMANYSIQHAYCIL